MSRPDCGVAGNAPSAAVAADQAAALLARDRAARREAQTRFDRPLVLEAGAGSGARTIPWRPRGRGSSPRRAHRAATRALGRIQFVSRTHRIVSVSKSPSARRVHR